ncbi:GntP family permease [Streptomonospora arabica]|uniref:GntP family permease n=1 Tax=Streptomonospora arabica TaxID=412417 RepID=A0ABV9SF56_9ACTN
MIDLLWLLLSILVIVLLIIKLRLHPAVSLVIGTLMLGLLTRIPLPDLAGAAAGGFGELMAGIGLSVGFGIILGQLLSDSGGARVIARTLVNATSERFAMYGLAGAAFVLSIPVFYDVTFVILVPLAVAIAREAGKPMPLAVGAVALGAGTAHTLVPPTPNPLAAGEIMDFDVGIMLLVGGIGALVAVILAVAAYSAILPRIWRPKWDEEGEPAFVEHEADPDRREPGFLLSLLPLFTPILLILLGTVWSAAAGDLPGWLAFATDKTVALLLGVLVAYAVASRNMSRHDMDRSAATAVQSAGIVLLITGAGGAFGAIIEKAGIGDLIADSVSAVGGNFLVALLACYLVGMAFRLAVGSGTVASITTMTIMSSLGPTVGVHPVWVAMACLAGALSLGHINDSGFWVTARLPGFSVSGGLKTYTLAQFLASVFALVFALLGAALVPMG